MHILLVSKNTAEKYISPFDGDVRLQLNASRQIMNNIFEVFCSKKSWGELCAMSLNNKFLHYLPPRVR